MKKYLITFSFIFLLISNAKAGWVEVGKLNQPVGKMYIDLTTLSDDGKYLYIWTLKSYEAPITIDNKSMLSGKTYEKINCNPKGSAGVQYLCYDGKMGSGKATPFQRDQLKWNYFPPGTIMGNVIEALCDNR